MGFFSRLFGLSNDKENPVPSKCNIPNTTQPTKKVQPSKETLQYISTHPLWSQMNQDIAECLISTVKHQGFLIGLDIDTLLTIFNADDIQKLNSLTPQIEAIKNTEITKENKYTWSVPNEIKKLVQSYFLDVMYENLINIYNILDENRTSTASVRGSADLISNLCNLIFIFGKYDYISQVYKALMLVKTNNLRLALAPISTGSNFVNTDIKNLENRAKGQDKYANHAKEEQLKLSTESLEFNAVEYIKKPFCKLPKNIYICSDILLLLELKCKKSS